MNTNRIYFCLVASALLLIVSKVNAEEPLLEPSPDFVPKPMIKTGDMAKKAFDFMNSNKEDKKIVDMADLKPADKVEKRDDKPEEPIKIVDPVPEPHEIKQAKVVLPPIMPILGGMSPFLKSIFASPEKDLADDSASDFDTLTNLNDHEHPFLQKRPHGVMTIVLIKSSKAKPNGERQEVSPDSMPDLLERIRPNLDFIMQKMLPTRLSQLFGGEKDFADREREMSDMMIRHNQLLGGGDHDIDRIRFEKQPTLIGAEENLINHNPFVFRTDNGRQAFIADDFGRNEEQRPQPKKCMMMSFMRLKASAYYRTVIHLLFFSGIILLFLFMIILTIRVYKRRRALRYYNQNLNVATISNEDLPPKGNGNGNTFLFRSGSLRNSYAQKLAENTSEANNNISSSLLFHGPPAYEKIISNSTKLTRQNSSLAKAYKKEAEEDSKSTSSLPAYNEALASKPSNI